MTPMRMMNGDIQYGMPSRLFSRSLAREVSFARTAGFDFLQMWYDSRGLEQHPAEGPSDVAMQAFGFPAIIHAVLDVTNLEEHLPRLKTYLNTLGHFELIIHPVCKREPFSPRQNEVLARKVAAAQLELAGVRLFVENNSRLDPIFSTPDDLSLLLAHAPDVGFLLDLAHVDTVDDIARFIAVRMPEILHVADRRHGQVHEHLPVGSGDFDFTGAFSGPLASFFGKIIFEVTQSDEDLIRSKDTVSRLIESRSR